jgi:excisionase family DNA binding protein
MLIALLFLLNGIFSIKSAAKEFFGGQISEWTLRSWIRTGKLPAYRAGARVLIRREDLENFCKPRPVNSGAAREARQ